MTLYLAHHFEVEECCTEGCGIAFAMTTDHVQRLRANPGTTFHCPNGHAQHYTGKSDEEKLREAAARETGLRDQLEASIRDGERARQLHARDRQRIANGVCPCCNRYFDNVRRHMTAKHPDYAAPEAERRIKFGCGCGRKFDTYHGLRVHQARLRSKNWAKPGQPAWSSHLTAGATR